MICCRLVPELLPVSSSSSVPELKTAIPLLQNPKRFSYTIPTALQTSNLSNAQVSAVIVSSWAPALKEIRRVYCSIILIWNRARENFKKRRKDCFIPPFLVVVVLLFQAFQNQKYSILMKHYRHWYLPLRKSKSLFRRQKTNQNGVHNSSVSTTSSNRAICSKFLNSDWF